MQILRVVPYSATQLYSYEVLKKRFQNEKGELSISSRLAAGGLAGMVATLVSCKCCLAYCLLHMPISSCTWLIPQLMSGHSCMLRSVHLMSRQQHVICNMQTSCRCVLVHMLPAQPSRSSMLAAYLKRCSRWPCHQR